MVSRDRSADSDGPRGEGDPGAPDWLRRLVRGRVEWPRVLLVALALAVAVAVVALAATSTAAFGLYNPWWDGTADFREGIESDPAVEEEIVRDTARYDELDANETVAFVMAPDEPYEGADADRMRAFVADGGTLVVLENFGPAGNELLLTVGAEARFDGRLLRDEQHHFRGPAMPIATGVEDHPWMADVEQLTLNYATAVDPGEDVDLDELDEPDETDGLDEAGEPADATVLVRTSEFAYLGPEDADLDEIEPAAYPVATVEDVGDGRAVAVGDPSIAINAMIGEPDNEAFLRGLYADADRVVVDVSHAEDLPPAAEAVLALRGSPALQLLVGVVGIAAIAGLARRRVRPTISRRLESRLPARFRPIDGDAETVPAGLSDDERVEFLRRRYPEWDEERIRRVITALNRDDVKGEAE